MSTRYKSYRDRWKRLPKSKKSPYDVHIQHPQYWTPGSDTPSFCSHGALDCSKKLCANIGKDLILPPQVSLHSKSDKCRYQDKQLQKLTCPYLLTNSSSSSSDISTDSGISQGNLTHGQEPTTPVFMIAGSVPSQMSQTKYCPSGRNRHVRLSMRQSLSAATNIKTLPTESRQASSPMDDVSYLSDKLSSSLSQSKRRQHSSAYSSSVVLQSTGKATIASMIRPSSAACIHSAHDGGLLSNSTDVFDRLSKPKLPVNKNKHNVATRRPSSAISFHTGLRHRLPTDSTDDVFIRLSRPKQSTSENNQADISSKRHSVIGIELFERLSMPKVVPKPHKDMFLKNRYYRPVASEFFDRLAQPKSRSSRSSSVVFPSLDVPILSHFSTDSGASLSSKRSCLVRPISRSSRSSSVFSQSVDVAHLREPTSSDVSLSSRRHTTLQTVPLVSRWQSFMQSPSSLAGTVTNDPILEVDGEDIRSRSVSVSSLNASDVTQEASALLSYFESRNDSVDELQLLLSLDDINEDEDVFLSSLDSQTYKPLTAKEIHEKEIQSGEEDSDIELETTDKADMVDMDVEGILKSAEMLLHSQDIDAKDN